MDPADTDVLNETLRALALEDAALRPAARVEANLRARVRSRASTRWTWRTSLAAAAAVVLFVMVWRFVPSQAPERLASGELPAPTLDTGFLPLPYAHVPAASGHLVRMSVPRTALIAFGLDPGHASDADVVLADVFVGEDGIARSVRFVAPSISEEPQR